MNGTDIKKAAVSKAKQVAAAANNAANGNGTKKRRKGGDLKPIITTEDQQNADSSPKSANMNSTRSVPWSFLQHPKSVPLAKVERIAPMLTALHFPYIKVN